MADGKATQNAMDLLHGLMADSMTDELKRSMERASAPPHITDPVTKETSPNPNYEPLSPKLLGVIRAFLKDNGIDAPATSPRFNSLVGELRDLDFEDQATIGRA